MSKQDTRAKTARRRHEAAFKHALIERSLQPGASVSAIALEHGINTNLLFKWRREHLRTGLPAALGLAHRRPAAMLLPVNIEQPPGDATTTTPSLAHPGDPRMGIIEIDLGPARIRLRGSVDPANLRCVLHTLGALR